MQVRKQQLELDMEQQTGSKQGKEWVKAVYCHPAYLTYMQSTSWETVGCMKQSWNQECPEKYQLPQICRWHHPYSRKRRGPKESLDESERGEWKIGFKLNIQKIRVMTSGPITSWQINGKTVETVADFIFLCSKITADGDCSHEIKRRLLIGSKVMTNLDSILKSRDTTLPTKVCLVKAMAFPVVMYGCESWTIKKAEHRELMLLNCGVGKDPWESLGLWGDPTSPS